jgi:hypothetical protein
MPSRGRSFEMWHWALWDLVSTHLPKSTLPIWPSLAKAVYGQGRRRAPSARLLVVQLSWLSLLGLRDPSYGLRQIPERRKYHHSPSNLMWFWFSNTHLVFQRTLFQDHVSRAYFFHWPGILPTWLTLGSDWHVDSLLISLLGLWGHVWASCVFGVCLQGWGNGSFA